MSRGFGEVELLQELLPVWAVAVAGVLTQLGDAWFLSLLLGSVFLGSERHRVDIVALLGVTLGSTGLYRSLKHLLEFPRPAISPLGAGELHPVVEGILELTAAPVSYGFPSGHATGAAVVYLGVASTLAIWSRRKRFLAAGAMVALVATTRLVLAVHFLVDVVAGVALGATFVALVFVGPRELAPEHRIPIAYGTAIPLAGLYLVTSSGELESVLLLGATVAVPVGWHLLCSLSPRPVTPTD